MTPKILLRIAAFVILFHNIGHNIGQLGWKHSPDGAKQEVIERMIAVKSPFMGATHSMADYYDGYSFACTLAFLLISAILWFLTDDMALYTPLAKKIQVTLAIILFFWGINELIFFFPFAASFSLSAMLLIILALMRQKKTSEPHS